MHVIAAGGIRICQSRQKSMMLFVRYLASYTTSIMTAKEFCVRIQDRKRKAGPNETEPGKEKRCSQRFDQVICIWKVRKKQRSITRKSGALALRVQIRLSLRRILWGRMQAYPRG